MFSDTLPTTSDILNNSEHTGDDTLINKSIELGIFDEEININGK